MLQTILTAKDHGHKVAPSSFPTLGFQQALCQVQDVRLLHRLVSIQWTLSCQRPSPSRSELAQQWKGGRNFQPSRAKFCRTPF